MGRMSGFGLGLAILSGCGGGGSAPGGSADTVQIAPPARAYVFSETERMSGTLFGTFGSHLPTFARDPAGRIYKTYTVDSVINNFRNDPVEVRIARLTNDGTWKTLWGETLHSDPACLVDSGGAVWAAVSDFQTAALTVLEIREDTVRSYVSPEPFATAAKNNCAVFDNEFILSGTYGNLARFSLASRTFLPQQQAVTTNYEGTAVTQYPHFSVLTDRLLMAWSGVPDGVTWRHTGLISYVVSSVAHATLATPWKNIAPPDLASRNSWTADTAALNGRFYFAATVNDYKANTEYFADFAGGLLGNKALFGICDLQLSCTIQRTDVSQDLAGNFVLNGSDLLFIGGGPKEINIWRLNGSSFDLVQKAPHNIECSYSWNFAPFIAGDAIHGQVISAPAWCNPSAPVDETYIGFKLTLN